MLEGPLSVGRDRGEEATGNSTAGSYLCCGDGVEVVDDEEGLAPMLAFMQACDLISWSLFRMRFEVVARGPFGPGFEGFFA